MQIPQEAFDRIAEVMLPLMQEYFESEEGKIQMEIWKKSLEQKEPALA